MDEKPVQFFDDFRKGFRSKKDGVQYEDYQYIRNGTASIFLFTEPLAGWRYADAQERRTAHDWAKQILFSRQISSEFVKTIQKDLRKEKPWNR